MPPAHYDSIPASTASSFNEEDTFDEYHVSNGRSVGDVRSWLDSKKLLAAGLMVCGCVLLALAKLPTTPSSDSTVVIPILSSTNSDHSATPPLLLLSERVQSIKPGRDDMAMFLAGAADPYHPVNNKNGYLVMLVAENKLMWHEMAEKLRQLSISSGPLPEWILDYGDMGGEAEFKASVAKIMQRWIVPYVNLDNLRFQAGAGSILDCLSWCLANPGDGVLVTGPNYPAFVSDFGARGQVQLHVAPAQASNDYAPTIEELEECFDRSTAAGNPPKILIICQPNNPTGVIYSPDSMRLMITWALQKGLHVVSDEIYALSVFPGYHTTSAAQIMSELNQNSTNQDKYLGDQVHVVAGLSKDWGMSGFRVGSLFTHNEKLLQVVDMLGYYQSVSQYTQYAVTKLFEDDAWVDWYVSENQRRLAASYDALKEELASIGVTLYPSKGALFAWADFSSFLKDGQTEKELWVELFEIPKVLFTTGESCHGEKPGMFRVVYPWPEGGVEAIRELGRRLVKWKNGRDGIEHSPRK